MVPAPAAVVEPPVAAMMPPVFDHPLYSNMIIEAIGALKERNGSSKRVILAHKRLPSNHDELLTQHLKLLKSSGQLVMVRKSYKFAPSATSNVLDGSSAPKRGRRRPPKAKLTISATNFGS
ncbi:hypothetical protein ES332_A07G259900v1 [Gossypium tomentosum]|uniref:H15 domain-containing protein n=1 Tax=Gossypium tomentosum TaxID=34277 RepID=A0A5D2PZY0_GOSTO|nr:hypothetical protein ES332_A07G259900v1 [Gossypium tomentosum]